MTGLDKASGWAGVASVLLTNVATVGATVASPSFEWTGNALSDLGQPGTPVATPVTTLLFDGGLVLGGLVGLGFAYTLWTAGENVVERLAVLPFAVALVGMAGVGVFPSSQPLHAPAAVTLYLASMVAMAVYAVGNAVASALRRGAVTLGLVCAHVGVWWWWASGGSVARDGLAIPEIVGAFLFSAWVLWTAHWHLAGERAPDGAGVVASA
ncbi:DUF998 domain-containing protein [Haloarcula pellucida]|uniref:DUF998 domain-containing protein n=1 Tax=Haloarcula pellucida TaxID=1427151 RepID=A0A830GJ39_9EURY|nr:DUF998 domain-containing protein [Halomicroarcula pellucida]MBX0347252.1 DUF998 domain-containing protein [Halomicroarcula pellucida]GGN87747.1 hypothetical protein GCM10009030_06730 [Halomicroarcula pellucida]